MSVKLFNAFRIPMDSEEAFSLYADGVAVSKIKKNLWDLYETRNPDTTSEQALEKIREIIQISRHFRASVLNFSAGYEIIPDHREKKFMILPYGLLDFSGEDLPEYMEEFSFWDSTDPPENINPEDWRKREEIWRRLLIRTDHPMIYLRQLIVSDVNPHPKSIEGILWNLSKKIISENQE